MMYSPKGIEGNEDIMDDQTTQENHNYQDSYNEYLNNLIHLIKSQNHIKRNMKVPTRTRRIK